MLDIMIKLYLVIVVCYDIYMYGKDKNNMLCMDLDKYLELENYMQSLLGNYFIYYRLFLNIFVIFLVFLCGLYSDCYGRKIFVFLFSFGSVFVVLFYILSDLVLLYRIFLIFCGLVFQGFFGKSFVIIMVVNSIVCDVFLFVDCIKNFGILLVMNFFGVCIGLFFFGIF